MLRQSFHTHVLSIKYETNSTPSGPEKDLPDEVIGAIIGQAESSYVRNKWLKAAGFNHSALDNAMKTLRTFVAFSKGNIILCYIIYLCLSSTQP